MSVGKPCVWNTNKTVRSLSFMWCFSYGAAPSVKEFGYCASVGVCGELLESNKILQMRTLHTFCWVLFPAWTNLVRRACLL